MYLATKRFVNAGMLEDMLTNENIPHIKKCMRGAGLGIYAHIGRQDFTFFVPFFAYKRAKEILDTYFPGEY
jgi:hypothetical protein